MIQLIQKKYLKKLDHPILKYLGVKKFVVLFCRGGFYHKQIILEKDILRLYPRMGKEAYFVFDTFEIRPQVIRIDCTNIMLITEIILFPVNKTISNSLNLSMVREGINDLKTIRKNSERNITDFVFIIPKKWIQLERLLKSGGWNEGTYTFTGR